MNAVVAQACQKCPTWILEQCPKATCVYTAIFAVFLVGIFRTYAVWLGINDWPRNSVAKVNGTTWKNVKDASSYFAEPVPLTYFNNGTKTTLASIRKCEDVQVHKNGAVLVTHGVTEPFGAVTSLQCSILIDIAGGMKLTHQESALLHANGLRTQQVFRDSRTVIQLHHSHDATYWHFMFQTLPRLECLLEAGLLNRDEVYTVRAPKLAEIYLKTFTNFVLYTGERNIVADRILIPCPLQQVSPAQIRKVFSRYKHTFLTPPGWTRPNRPYVVLASRFGHGREMRNRMQVISTLQREFPRVQFVAIGERLSLIPPEYSIEYFKRACGVIGMHGAGLTNVCWMDNPGFLLEIRPPNQTNGLVYRNVARVCNHSYYLDETARQDYEGEYQHYGNYYVDLKRLLDVAKNAIHTHCKIR